MAAWLLLTACSPPGPAGGDRGPEPGVTPTAASLRRLTRAQYEASLADVFGAGLVLPPYLEPDIEEDGFFSVGAGTAALSPYGVEQYETAAYLVAGQIVDDPARAASLPCAPDARGCAVEVASTVGRRLWRRTLTADERDVLGALADEAAAALPDDPTAPVELVLAALLQSPAFVYRVELGDAGAFDGPALASRMSFLLWGGPPDDELLDLAEAGSLADPESRRDQVSRMAADPRAARGVRALFHELLGLSRLRSTTKDPTVFVHASPDVLPSAELETLALVERLWADDEDFRSLVTSRETSVDRTLAAIYGVPAPAREGFGPIAFAPDGERAGLLGHVSFLAMQSHPTSTSVTRRGLYVRERLLCQDMPAPPADVDTSIPESTPDSPTMRDRVAIHLENAACASCHRATDPLGLALEHFDGLGGYRADDQGYPIDATGELDGARFDGLGGLALTVSEHPDFARCLVAGSVRYAQGHALDGDEEGWVDWLDAGFAAGGWGYAGLLEDLVTSEAFAASGEGT